MTLSSDFWQSKQTWNGLLAIANTIVVQLLNRPDLLPIVALVHGALAAIFARDTVAKGTEAIKENTEAIKSIPETAPPVISLPPSPDRIIDRDAINALAGQLADSSAAIKEALETLKEKKPTPPPTSSMISRFSAPDR